MDRLTRVRELNDHFREFPTLYGGTVVLTQDVAHLPIEKLKELTNAVKAFNAFSDDTPEHDFGVVDVQGEKYFWKIDYYDAKLECGSPDATNPEVTRRVLTLMHSSEY